MIETSKFARKPFFVEAVRVTPENMADVAAWCQGTVQHTDDKQQRAFIKVRVVRALNIRQTQAFAGDWVLYAGTGYKVYTNKAFNENFDATEETTIVPTESDETVNV